MTLGTQDMKYTLINQQGKVRTFFVKAVAELYQQIEGGVIVTKGVLKVSEYKEAINVE